MLFHSPVWGLFCQVVTSSGIYLQLFYSFPFEELIEHIFSSKRGFNDLFSDLANIASRRKISQRWWLFQITISNAMTLDVSSTRSFCREKCFVWKSHLKGFGRAILWSCQYRIQSEISQRRFFFHVNFKRNDAWRFTNENIRSGGDLLFGFPIEGFPT